MPACSTITSKGLLQWPDNKLDAYKRMYNFKSYTEGFPMGLLISVCCKL